MKSLFTLVLSSLIFAGSSFAADNSSELLKASDRARGGIQGGVSWTAKITTMEDGESSERTFLVKVKGDDALAEALSPARNKGEVFLFNNRNMWFFKPSLRKPVSISARQKLSGQAANGDIASTNYVRDYTASSVGKEKVNGEETQVFLLKAKSNEVTYDQIKYWVSLKRKVGVKAEFMTLQGQPFKIANFKYDNNLNAGGKGLPFVSKMEIQDAKFPDNKSVIEYTTPKAENLSSSIFNVNNLSR